MKCFYRSRKKPSSEKPKEVFHRRKQTEEGFQETRNTTRTRNTWKKNSDNNQPKISCDSSPQNLQPSKKKSGINTIEIRIKKTDEKHTKSREKAHNKSVKIIEPKSSDKEMHEKNRYLEQRENSVEEDDDVRIQAGIMINAQGGRFKDKGPYQYSRKVEMILEKCVYIENILDISLSMEGNQQRRKFVRI